MSSAGHVLDMIKRIKQNRALRPSKKQKFKSHNREGIHHNESSDKAYFKEFPQEQVNLVISQIRKDARIQRKQELVLYFIVAFLALVVLFAFVVS